MNELELYHHGIRGMRWGVRRFQKKNGQLTAAGRKRYADENQNGETSKSKRRLSLEAKYRKKGMSQDDAEKAADKRIKVEKVLAATAGLTVAAATAYVATKHIQERADTIIKSGTKLQRIGRFAEEDLDRPFYAAFNEKDKVKYAGMYGKQIQAEGANAKVHRITLDVKSDVKVASRKKAVDAFVDLYKNDPEFKETVDKRNSRFYNLEDISKMTDKQLRKKGYDEFNKALVDHSDDSNAVAKKFYDRLKKQGYDAIMDINDQKYSGYNAKKPVIVFNKGNKIAKESVQELDSEKIGSFYKKANTMLVNDALKSAAISSGAQFAAAIGATKLYTTMLTNASVNRYRIEHPNTGLTDKEIIKLINQQAMAGRR